MPIGRYLLRPVALCTALVALASSSAVTPAQAQNGGKVKPLYGKVASPITAVYNSFAAAKRTRSTFSASSVLGSTGIRATSTSVAAEIAVTGTVATVRAQLVALGVTIVGEYGPHFDVVLPFALIDDVALLPQVAYVAPNYGAGAGVGATTTQGDRSLRADVLRSTASIDGTGQKVGVISDSFNNSGNGSYATDQSTSDLPAGVDVVQEDTNKGIDEGRAMLQIVHDVAPGAGLAFATGILGQASMAANIQKLRTAGCTIVTDDIYYFAAPFFMDGIVARSVNQCVNAGVPYFVLANNHGHESYESTFSSSTSSSFPQRIIGGETGDSHDFDPGSGVDDLQQITIPAYASVRLIFQWDDQWKTLNPTSNGAQNDFDFFLTDSTGATVLASSKNSNVGGDPVEDIYYNSGSSAARVCNLVILRVKGTATPRIKYISFNQGATVNEYATNSATALGNSNAARALTIGAAYYGYTPRYGVTPAVAESFSSRGGIPILRDESGNPIAQVVRSKPDIVATDGVDTTFFGSSSGSVHYFYGTSAAAPHAAAVAALLLQGHPRLTPDRLYSAMRTTALDMSTAGFDYDTGYGLLNAETAASSLKNSQSGSSFTVTNATDTGDGVCDAAGTYDGCSLREAVTAANDYNTANANAGATITFAPATFGSSKQPITLGGTELPAITSLVTITGPTSAGAGVTISAGNVSRIVTVNSGGTLKLSFLTLTAGTINGATGGAILNNGTLTVSNSTFSANSAPGGPGGAIYNAGTLNVSNSTFSSNSAEVGGALYNTGTATVTSATFAGNTAGSFGGALLLYQGTLKLTNSIVAGNSATSGPNIYNNATSDSDYNLVDNTGGTVLPGTHNIVGKDAVLGALADNGGPTLTRALLGGSPAIGAGSMASASDQRGVARDSAPDMGAYEFVNVAPTVSSIIPSSPSNNVGETRAFSVTVNDANGVSDIKEVWFLANTKLSWDGGTTLAYLPATNQLYLRDGDQFAAPITPGSGTLSNNAVSIDGATVSVSTTATSLTLNFTCTVKAGMVGANKLWGRVQDLSGAVDPASLAGEFGQVQKGTWTVNGASGAQQRPTLALSPGAKGTSTNLMVGTEFTLNVDLSDPNGAGDLQAAYIVVNAPGNLDWGRGFTLVYEARSNRLYLRSTDGSSFLGGGVVGQGTGTLENEAGSVRLSGCTATPITNGVHLSLPVTFKGAFAGTQQVWSHIEDTAGNAAVDGDAAFGFKTEGTFTISNAQEVAPSAQVLVAGVAAGKGTTSTVQSGVETSFTLNLSDGNGAGQLDSGWLLINTVGNLNWAGGITLVVEPRTNRLYLRSSDGQSWSAATLGSSSGTLENEAVSVRVAGCTLTRVSQGFSLVVAVTPKAGFAGTKQMWSRVQDTAGNTQADRDADLGFNTEGRLNITNPAAPASNGRASGGSS